MNIYVDTSSRNFQRLPMIKYLRRFLSIISNMWSVIPILVIK